MLSRPAPTQLTVAPLRAYGMYGLLWLYNQDRKTVFAGIPCKSLVRLTRNYSPYFLQMQPCVHRYTLPPRHVNQESRAWLMTFELSVKRSNIIGVLCKYFRLLGETSDYDWYEFQYFTLGRFVIVSYWAGMYLLISDTGNIYQNWLTSLGGRWQEWGRMIWVQG
jgi:hypothetical protein